MPQKLPTRWGVAFSTPMGALAATASDAGLRTVGFDLESLAEVEQTQTPVLDAFGRFLRAYLSRRFDELPEVPIDPEGTDFDRAVWQAVRRVGPGRTATYGDIASSLGSASHARAVGTAVGRNPLLIVVPCHRIVGAKGKLRGFSAGMERKVWLLKHERVLLL